MQGTITFDGTVFGGISRDGGGSSNVSITPTVTEGTKIADYSIDSESGSLYAPTPEELPDTIVTKALRKYNDDTQTKIMTITTLDTENSQEVSQDIYAPSPVQCWYTPGLEQDYQIGQFTYGGVTQNVYIPYFQRPLTAGANITIDPDTDTISASNNYSSNEQVVGTWFGKPLYRRAYHFDQSNLPTDRDSFDEILNVNEVIKITGVYNWLNFQDSSNLDIRCYALGENSPQASNKAIWLLMEGSDSTGINFYLDFNFNGKDRSKILKMCAFVEYTKTTD